MSSSIKKNKINKPVFILGPERSGTTLLYSILANADEFYWLSRIDSLFPSWPYTANILRKLINIFDVGTYSAEYKGVSSITGLNTPSESIPYWRKIFGFGDEENYLIKNDLFKAKDVTKKIQHFIYSDFYKRLKLSNKDRLLFKQPGFSLKIEFWNKLFEDALFLICIRGIEDNIESYCKIKKDSEEQFWGTKVPGWEKYLQAECRKQTAYQLYKIYSLMLNSIAGIDSDFSNRVMLVPYEKMTKKPVSFLSEVLEFCEVEQSEKILNSIDNIKKRESKREEYLADSMDVIKTLTQQKKKTKEILNHDK